MRHLNHVLYNLMFLTGTFQEMLAQDICEDFCLFTCPRWKINHADNAIMLPLRLPAKREGK